MDIEERILVGIEADTWLATLFVSCKEARLREGVAYNDGKAQLYDEQ
jgi:hypothetical protein